MMETVSITMNTMSMTMTSTPMAIEVGGDGGDNA